MSDPQLSKYETATSLLADPKAKMTSRHRRRLQRIRQRAVGNPQQPKDGMLRLTEALAKRSARRLVRFIKQSARRASTAKHILAGLAPDSKFRPAVEETQKFNIIAFVAATTELENRGKAQAN